MSARQYQKLGKTNINVSRVWMGCWAIVGDETWGPQKESDAIQAIRTAVDIGINSFDTAELYGDGYSEELLGKALSHRRPEVVIATKVSPSHFSQQEMIKACENSLHRLKTDYIDLYQLHWPSREVPIDEILETMQKLKDRGKIRAIGVCNFGRGTLREALTYNHIEVNQLPYSLLWRSIEYEILPACIEDDIGVICYSPLAQGLLTGKFHSPDEVPDGRARTRHFSSQRPSARHDERGAESETFTAIDAVRGISKEVSLSMNEVSLAWLLTQKGVVSVVVGARNAEQVRQNAGAADLELPSEIVDELTDITEELKGKLGPNPDMWQSESRVQ